MEAWIIGYARERLRWFCGFDDFLPPYLSFDDDVEQKIFERFLITTKLIETKLIEITQCFDHVSFSCECFHWDGALKDVQRNHPKSCVPNVPNLRKFLVFL